MKQLTLDPSQKQPPTRDHKDFPSHLPDAKEIKVSPASTGGENAGLFFIGTATTIIEWEGVRILTDPNFLHAGDHVHLGPGVTSARLTNPAIGLHEVPHIDAILLSHYHADHFDQEVEASLRRSIPIITTPHAKRHLTSKGEDESFTQVYDLDFFDSMLLNIKTREGDRKPAIKVTGMPGKHVPPGPLSVANDILSALPPTNGWLVELGYFDNAVSSFQCGYRIYISGDTLMVPELKEIPERYKGQGIDLMLIHLGGTTIPSPKMPLLMVSMNETQGVQLIQLINPDLTIPIHFDDYDVMLSPLADFKKAVEEAGFAHKVVYLDRKDQFRFKVIQG
ncbi:Metallo-hydrolase/oxidoreductase [Westerdykella ornata]|uniref:Metallo-hydrolase/oxidoreductase n=1 Tax=Westerdykella ornata TaxID=318751 RepID=A0A6A6JQX9_WESOR|nr:Metallo-hydrolase/oxidoreductase [Westerdykella ornata]KAF2279050.1 Metallo-hydrolase/oxidoreductase [Westerdykella ornata]